MHNIKIYVILKNSWYEYEMESYSITAVKACYTIEEAHQIVSDLNSGNVGELDEHLRSTYYFEEVEGTLPSWVDELIDMNNGLLEMVELYKDVLNMSAKRAYDMEHLLLGDGKHFPSKEDWLNDWKQKCIESA